MEAKIRRQNSLYTTTITKAKDKGKLATPGWFDGDVTNANALTAMATHPTADGAIF